jgi:CxxC-x17-CxxC domain-containing protein
MQPSRHALSSHEDQERMCADCGQPFLYTAAERRFREEQGMAEPSRCPQCRAERRAQRNIDIFGASSGSHLGSSRDRRQQRRGRNGGDGTSGDRYPAICADCGASTMVPFIPRGDRPVYCRSCFNARKGR